jgi:hypothetical protein
MENVLIIVSVLVPIIAGLTQVVKQYVREKFYALVPVLIGLLLGPAYTVFSPDLSVWELLWAGGLAGLAAGGFYSVQNVRNK